jgi:hypothetical protein
MSARTVLVVLSLRASSTSSTMPVLVTANHQIQYDIQHHEGAGNNKPVTTKKGVHFFNSFNNAITSSNNFSILEKSIIGVPTNGAYTGDTITLLPQ